jgi:hypothetical protein
MLSKKEFLKSLNLDESVFFVKCVKRNRIHRGYEYVEGINKDIIEFYPHDKCHAGGLYFTTTKYIDRFLHFGDDIAIIKLCNDSKIYKENHYKFKADKFMIIAYIPKKILFESNYYIYLKNYLNKSFIEKYNKWKKFTPNHTENNFESYLIEKTLFNKCIKFEYLLSFSDLELELAKSNLPILSKLNLKEIQKYGLNFSYDLNFLSKCA